MNPSGTRSRDIEEAWQQVNLNMTEAMREIATELGGEEFANTVMATATTKDEPRMPKAEALKLLHNQYPGSVEQVLERAETIGDEKLTSALAEQQKHRHRILGKLLLRGFASIGGGMASIGKGMSGLSLKPFSDRKGR